MPPETLADRLARVRQTVAAACEKAGREPGAVRIVAITKGHPSRAVIDGLNEGLLDVGENRVHEALLKFGEARQALAGPGVRRHMVGHLQRNKVRDAVGIFDWIQSIDSLRLASAVSERMAGRTDPMQVLVEVNAVGEEQKHGFPPEAAVEQALEIAELTGLVLRGVMAMAPWTDDEDVLRRTFRVARGVFEELRAQRPGDDRLDTLSMGMSNDYSLAVEEGATMIRLGTALFGGR